VLILPPLLRLTPTGYGLFVLAVLVVGIALVVLSKASGDDTYLL